MRTLSFLTILTAGLTLTAPLWADELSTCEVQHDLDRYALLRRLSLDLRGKIPTIEEYEALDAVEAVPDVTIQEMIEGDDFRLAMRRYHEESFWPNISAVRLHNQNALLTSREPYALRNASAGRTKLYRGALDAACGDYEQTFFDPAFPGEFRPDPAHIQVDGMGLKHEGWRLVAPYWDPGTPIKVCAYDAQETKSATVKGKLAACNTVEGNLSPACGCGPDARYCYSPGSVVDNTIRASLREQLNRSIDAVTSGAKADPYTDLLLSTKAEQNGPIAFWKRNLAPNLSLSTTYDLADPDEEVLDKGYLDEAWKKVDRKGLHAGVLTLPAYLLRFQTNRGRANRFRIAFQCQYFVPPDKLEPAAGCGETASDLTQRCNCQYCHQTLEPMAAHFGLFAEAGTTLMSDETLFPKIDPTCSDTTPSGFCARFYVTQPDAHNTGSLLAYQFADTHPDIQANLEAGPRALAQSIIDDGTFAQCTVKKLFFHFAKRDMAAAGATTAELALLKSLAEGFAQNQYDFRWLVREIVTLPQYRKAR